MGNNEVIATTQLSCECARRMHWQHGLPVAEGSGHEDKIHLKSIWPGQLSTACMQGASNTQRAAAFRAVD